MNSKSLALSCLVGLAATFLIASASNAQRSITDISFSTELMQKSAEILQRNGMDRFPILPGQRIRTDAEWKDVISRFDDALNRSGNGIQDMSGLFNPDTARDLGLRPTPSSAATRRFAAPASELFEGLSGAARSMEAAAARAGNSAAANRWHSWATYYSSLAQQGVGELPTGTFIASNVAAFAHAEARARAAGYDAVATLFHNTWLFWYSLGSQIQANRQPVAVVFPPELFRLSAQDVLRLQKQHEGAFH